MTHKTITTLILSVCMALPAIVFAAQPSAADAIAPAAMYDGGLGANNDVKAATQWYEKAAVQGHAPSLAILGKNAVAKGGVAFSYQSMRLKASKQILTEYARQTLMEQNRP